MYVKPKKIGQIKFLRGGIKRMIESEGIPEGTLRDRLTLTDQDEYRSEEILNTQVMAVKVYNGVPVNTEGRQFMPKHLARKLKVEN